MATSLMDSSAKACWSASGAKGLIVTLHLPNCSITLKEVECQKGKANGHRPIVCN